MSELEADDQTREDKTADEETADLTLEYQLDAPPEKVWRALSLPAFRETWLPGRDLQDETPVSAEPGTEISYRMKEDEPPFLESQVTFQIRPDGDGGTRLRVIHVLVDEAETRLPLKAANGNRPVMMRAA